MLQWAVVGRVSLLESEDDTVWRAFDEEVNKLLSIAVVCCCVTINPAPNRDNDVINLQFKVLVFFSVIII